MYSVHGKQLSTYNVHSSMYIQTYVMNQGVVTGAYRDYRLISHPSRLGTYYGVLRT